MDHYRNLFSMFQPGLLSKEDIINILEERCLPRECLAGKEKEELVEIYNRVARPLPCRRRNSPPPLQSQTVEDRTGSESENKPVKSAFDLLAPSASSTKLKRDREPSRKLSNGTTVTEDKEKITAFAIPKASSANGNHKELDSVSVKRTGVKDSMLPEKADPSGNIEEPLIKKKNLVTWP